MWNLSFQAVGLTTPKARTTPATATAEYTCRAHSSPGIGFASRRENETEVPCPGVDPRCSPRGLQPFPGFLTFFLPSVRSGNTARRVKVRQDRGGNRQMLRRFPARNNLTFIFCAATMNKNKRFQAAELGRMPVMHHVEGLLCRSALDVSCVVYRPRLHQSPVPACVLRPPGLVSYNQVAELLRSHMQPPLKIKEAPEHLQHLVVLGSVASSSTPTNNAVHFLHHHAKKIGRGSQSIG